MNIPAVNNKIVFINPYDIRGGASMGTFRLFSFVRHFISNDVRLHVIVKSSSEISGVFGLSYFFRIVFYLQAAFNKFICWILANDRLPVAFTFFVPFSLPALALFLKSRSAFRLYLHSMSSGFSCPLSFYLFLHSASIVKTADDWYLTGGCHYSLDCNQWQSGCKSCPHMNVFGKVLVRFNWWLKRKVLTASPDFAFISPSNWLSSRYKYLYPGRCFVIFNSASSTSDKLLTSDSVVNCSSICHIGNLSSSSVKLVTLGLPVTYLRDKRKGFYEALPAIRQSLENFPVRLVLCGGDSVNYFNMITSSGLNLHQDSCIESLGSLSPKDMNLFYSKLDFLMHFARHDNSPNVVTESLCFGVPVIVLDNAGSPEHVRSSSAGFVISEIGQLVSIVSLICNNSVDISALKARAADYSKNVLSPQAMAEAYYRFLN